MTDKDTGGSAFPVTEFSADDEKGMDLRDYLAGHALSVLGDSSEAFCQDRAKVAAYVYSVADAIIAEKNKV